MAKQFNAFLSYQSVDRPWVTALKRGLEAMGLTVWLDQDEIRPGDLIVGALERALEQTNAVVLVVSPESIESGWVRERVFGAVALSNRRTNPVRLIPVLLRDAELPAFLANRELGGLQRAGAVSR